MKKNLIIALLFVTTLVFAQKKIDTAAINKTSRTIYELLDTKVDSAYQLIRLNLTASLKFKYAYGYSRSNLQLAQYYTLKGKNDSALLVIPTAIKYARISKDTSIIISSYLFNARSLSKASRNNAAIVQCLLAQRFAENTTNKKLIMKVYHDLGFIYTNSGLHIQAVNYFKKGLAIAVSEKDSFNIGNLSARIGGEFNYLSLYDSALVYNLNAVKLFRAIHHKRGIGVALTNLASTYNYLHQTEKAIATIKEALVIREELGDSYAVAILKNNLVDCYMEKKDYVTALKYAKEGEELAVEQNDRQLINQNYTYQASIYKHLNNYELAYKYANRCLILKDSITEANNLKAMGELEAKYENDKKEKEISLLQMEKKNAEEKADADRKRRNLILFSVSLITLIVTVFTFLLYKKFKETHRQKAIIQNQKHLVDEKNKEIIDSINYALTIQKAILPSAEELGKEVSDSFVLFKPKDIVSGDFYWHARVNDYLFFVVADCTGHGVPGAFMSLMGVSYLNEIINEKKVINTGEILNQLRDKVITNLNKSARSTEKRDGMDLVIMRINFKTNTLQFSGANNSIYILRHGVLNELKGNKMPVGLFTDDLPPFTAVEKEFAPSDTLIAFTDGLPDQFGGPKGKKFMYRQLENIICENSEMKMRNLNELICERFESWKGPNEQVDDITVLGIRL